MAAEGAPARIEDDASAVRAADAETIPVTDPWTGRVIAELPAATPSEVDEAVARARGAAAAWGRTTPTERSDALARAAAVIEAESETLVGAEVADAGRPLRLARRDVVIAVDALRALAGAVRELSGAGATAHARAHTTFVRRGPVGVVGVAASSSYPLLSAIVRVGTVLGAGNALVLAAHEETSLSSVRLASALRDVFPPESFSVLTGRREVVAHAITRHPDVSAVVVAQHPGVPMPPSSPGRARRHIERTGRNVAIVFDDVDAFTAANAVMNGAFAGSGQDRAALSRVLVHERVYDTFMGDLAEAVEGLAIGDPARETTTFGPVASRADQLRVFDHIARSRARGAVIVRGGEGGAPYGFFVQPTVMVAERTEAEPVGGPVLSVERFADGEDVVARANEDSTALVVSVFTHDLGRAFDATRRLDTGTVWVNTHVARGLDVPWSGFQTSADGLDNVAHAAEQFTRLTHVAIRA